jgi:biotin synthase-like enzyme
MRWIVITGGFVEHACHYGLEYITANEYITTSRTTYNSLQIKLVSINSIFVSSQCMYRNCAYCSVLINGSVNEIPVTFP